MCAVVRVARGSCLPLSQPISNGGEADTSLCTVFSIVPVQRALTKQRDREKNWKLFAPFSVWCQDHRRSFLTQLRSALDPLGACLQMPVSSWPPMDRRKPASLNPVARGTSMEPVYLRDFALIPSKIAMHIGTTSDHGCCSLLTLQCLLSVLCRCPNFSSCCHAPPIPWCSVGHTVSAFKSFCPRGRDPEFSFRSWRGSVRLWFVLILDRNACWRRCGMLHVNIVLIDSRPLYPCFAE